MDLNPSLWKVLNSDTTTIRFKKRGFLTGLKYLLNGKRIKKWKKWYETRQRNWGGSRGFLNLRDYHSPRSPNPFAILQRPSHYRFSLQTTRRGLRYGKIHGARCPLSYMLLNRRHTGPIYSKFMERETGRLFLVQAHRPFEIDEETFRSPSKRFAPACGGSEWIGCLGKNTSGFTLKNMAPALCFLDFS